MAGGSSAINAVAAAPDLARKVDGTPTTKTQRNFTDADSHLMQSGGSYLQGYNCQVAVDSDHQVIVAIGVSNQPPDFEPLEPMLGRIVASAGAMPDVMTFDAGSRMGRNYRLNAARCPESPTPRPALPASLDPIKDPRSTPSAKRLWNQ